MRTARLTEPRVASLSERAWAFLLDSVATLALWGLAVAVVSGFDWGAVQVQGPVRATATALFLLVPFVYFVLFEGLTQTTPGKAAVGLEVLDLEGRPLGLYGAFVRNTLRLAWELGVVVGPLFLALDVGMLQWTERGQRLGDVAAGSLVVARHPARLRMAADA